MKPVDNKDWLYLTVAASLSLTVLLWFVAFYLR